MQERTEDVSGVREEDEGLENEETAELEDAESEEPEDNSPTRETARETVERVLREAEREASGDEDEEQEEKPRQVRENKKQKEELPDIEPPSRFNAEEKQVFNKLPRQLKNSLSKMLNDHQAHFTRQTQQLSSAQREAQSIVEAVRPYLHAHPELLERGYTESKIVGGLIAAHQRLSDPKTALTAYLELGKQIGVDDEMLEALQGRYQNTKHQPQADITNHPQFRAMQEELNRVKSYTDGLQSQSFNQNVNKIVQEIEQVRNEKDALGNYVFPKMHDEEFLERVKPLVQTLRGNLPNASYGELFRRAYQVLEGGNSSAQPNKTRLPNQNNNRATQAAVSVRGKSAPSVGSSYEEDIPSDALANPRATVEWAIKQFRR